MQRWTASSDNISTNTLKCSRWRQRSWQTIVSMRSWTMFPNPLAIAGWPSPNDILETAIRQNRGTISFYEKEIFQLAGETSQAEALKKSAASVVALLKEYQSFLEGDLKSRATGDWRLGKEKFGRQLELELD